MKKKFVTSLVVLTLLCSVSATAFAATDNSVTPVGVSASSEVGANKKQLTPEQKAQFEAKRQEMMQKMQDAQKKWAAMTDAQKNEIYDLMDKQIDAKLQTIDKLSASGVIDKDTADKMKAKLTERKAQMRTSGEMPMFGGGKWAHKK
ncbi:MAG: DUF2680 domain-containing protein [Bacillota bacterium]|nr:DUF2680 domain-containing protein [Bacillota bacterium]